MGKGLNTVGKIVAWVLAILLLAGVAGVIVYFVAKEEGADYFVEYNGEKYLRVTNIVSRSGRSRART